MIELKQLDEISLKANKDKKYVIILDHTDKAADYYSYKAIQIEFNREVFQVTMGAKNKKQACEVLRSGFVEAILQGDHESMLEKKLQRFVIYIDNKMPNFVNEYNFEPDIWPSQDIFDYEKYRTTTSYNQIFTEKDEKAGLFNENIQIVILATYTDDDQARKILMNIPHSDKMAKY